jgi:hypothetical protein
MVRAHWAVPRDFWTQHGRTIRGANRLAMVSVVIGISLAGGGCAIVPKSRMDECQRLMQTLRSENARLKDRVLAVQGQNRDYAERAVDDARRLATQEEAIERLEHSVQAYQDERARLEAAYKQLASNLGAPELSKDEPQRPTEPKPAQMTRSPAPPVAREAKATPTMHADPAPR